MTKKRTNQYINNKDFLAAMIEYKIKVNAAKETNSQRPRVPNYIGSCIMKIATNLARKPNFVNYTFKDEMISDGIENCLQYIDNFDSEKSDNPFAYFTQIIYFAFLRRINKEKKLLYIKYKMTENVNLQHMASDRQEHDQRPFNDNIKMNDYTEEYMNIFIEDFEENKRRKVKKRNLVE